MNWFFLISGLLASAATFGHLTVGKKEYLKPMLDSDLAEVPKRVIYCVFHYITVMFILSSLFLILFGFGFYLKSGSTVLAHFIALNYALFACVQIILAYTSDIPKPLFKLFQWIFFLLIALFAFLGLFGV